MRWRHSETSILNLREHDPVREGFRTLQGFDKGLIEFQRNQGTKPPSFFGRSQGVTTILIWGMPGMQYLKQPVKIDVWFFGNTTKIYQVIHVESHLLAILSIHGPSWWPQSPAAPGVSKNVWGFFPKKKHHFFGAWAKCKQLRFTGWYLPNLAS